MLVRARASCAAASLRGRPPAIGDRRDPGRLADAGLAPDPPGDLPTSGRSAPAAGEPGDAGRFARGVRAAAPPIMAEFDLMRGPLHTLPDRVVERARTLAGGGLAGVYLTDVEGACLLRLAGDDDLPARVEAVGAVGPEFDEDGAAHLCAELANRWP